MTVEFFIPVVPKDKIDMNRPILVGIGLRTSNHDPPEPYVLRICSKVYYSLNRASIHGWSGVAIDGVVFIPDIAIRTCLPSARKALGGEPVVFSLDDLVAVP